MRAHDTMGKPETNITNEVLKRAADANGMTVPATLAVIATTATRDRRSHPAEYLAKPSTEIGRLEDDGAPPIASKAAPA